MSGSDHLQRLADYSAIRDLALRYCAAVDRHDWRLLGEVFVPGATVSVTDTTASMPDTTSDGARSRLMKGIDEILARYRRGLSKLDATHHMVTNHEITVESDSARHSCLVHAQHVRRDAAGGPHFTIGGRYEDQLIRTPHGWRIRHRELVVTWTEGNPRVLRPHTGSNERSEQPVAAQQNQHDASAEHPEQTTAGGWARRDAAAVWHGFTQMAVYEDSAPVIVERGEGNYLYDTDGRRYLDAISSLWVITLGHADGDLNRAAREQLDRISHSTLLGNGNTAAITLAEALTEVVPVTDPHFLFASDGAAAVEQAVKIAFQYWHNQGVTDRTAYLTLGQAYHGDSVGSLSVGDGGFGTDLFDPLRFPVIRTPGYDDGDWASKAIAAIDEHHPSLAAAVIEPLVQGAAGMLVTDPEQVAAFAAAVQARGVPLICDEVATGFGRTGALFASELCGIRPDLMCLGKGITGGYLPLSATVAASHVYEAFLGEDLGPRTFYHGHSYSGNALACAVATRHLELISERGLIDAANRAAERLGAAFEAVAALPAVKEVRRRGLMTGIELDPPPGASKWGRKVCAAAVRAGVLLRPLGDVVVVMPPLSITDGEIETIGRTLVTAIEEVANEAAGA